MHFHDVDLPQAVIDAHRRSEIVVFAGAGVSMDAPSNLGSLPNVWSAVELQGQSVDERHVCANVFGN
jgi:hypothetical protein